MITPQQVENRLLALSKEIDEAQDTLAMAEKHYFELKADYEISVAKERLKSVRGGDKLTVQGREDAALVELEAVYRALAAAEATVRAARANATRLRIQTDIARSVGTSVRTSIDMN